MLRHPVCSPRAAQRQIDRFAGLADMDHVRPGVLPIGVELPIVPAHGFWIIDDLEQIEIHHTEVTADDPSDVALYNRVARDYATSSGP